jgi:hypothetical protein
MSLGAAKDRPGPPGRVQEGLERGGTLEVTVVGQELGEGLGLGRGEPLRLAGREMAGALRLW